MFIATSQGFFGQTVFLKKLENGWFRDTQKHLWCGRETENNQYSIDYGEDICVFEKIFVSKVFADYLF